MNSLLEIRDQIIQSLKQYWEQIQETQVYGQLQDRYQNLTPQGQKITQVLCLFAFLGSLLYLPLSQMSVSQDLIHEFENQRELIRDLFKAYRSSGATPQVAPAPMSSITISTIQSQLQNSRLLPEQIISVSTAMAEQGIIPSSLLSEVVEVKLSKLNLKQIVEIGTQLTNISNAIKIKDLLIQAKSEMMGYFDVQFKLYSLKVPEPLPEAPPEPLEQKGKKKSDNEKEKE